MAPEKQGEVVDHTLEAHNKMNNTLNTNPLWVVSNIDAERVAKLQKSPMVSDMGSNTTTPSLADMAKTQATTEKHTTTSDTPATPEPKPSAGPRVTPSNSTDSTHFVSSGLNNTPTPSLQDLANKKPATEKPSDNVPKSPMVTEMSGNTTSPSLKEMAHKEDKPDEKASDKPDEKASDKPDEKASDKPDEKASADPAEKATEKPAEKATEKPAEKATEKPAEKATEKPADDKNHAQEHSEKDSKNVHNVVKGDSLWKIAHTHNTTVDALLKINPQIVHAELIHPGDKIQLPSTSETKSTPANADAKSAQTPQKDPAKNEEHHKTETPPDTKATDSKTAQNPQHEPTTGEDRKTTEAPHAGGTQTEPKWTMKVDVKPIDAKNTPVDVANSPEEIARVKEELAKLNPSVVQALWFTIQENAFVCPNGERIALDGKTEKVAISMDDGPNAKVYITCTRKPESGGNEVIVISNGEASDNYPRGISINGKLISPLKQDLIGIASNPPKIPQSPIVSDLGTKNWPNNLQQGEKSL